MDFDITIDPEQFDNNLWRGSVPKTSDDWNHLSRLKIFCTLDLETSIFDISGAQSEKYLDESFKYEIRPLCLPILPILPLRQSQLRSAINALKIAKSKNWSVYVHCRQGVDRTGMVVAAYKIKERGMPFDQALQDMYAHGFHRWRYAHWIYALKQFAESIHGS